MSRVALPILTLVLTLGIALASLAAPGWAEPITQAELDSLRQDLEAQIAEKQVNLDHVWTMVAAALVFLMQGGFLLLEAGLVRSKNSINVAQKNIADFVVATCAFYLVGFALMFGPTVGGWIGVGGFAFNQRDDWDFTFFVFQLVFCGTAATILSGAVAERMKFSGYLFATLIVSALVYPLYGHWAWGNLLIEDNAAWLADLGFIDFAGSTVVHSIGGWIALAAVVVLGPRIGRFDENGKPLPIHGHSAVLATLGALLLWTGWIGFNGGSTTVGSGDFAHIVANTMISASFGGVVAMFLGRQADGLYRPMWPINGVLAGLVGITAGCDAVSTYGAVAIGASSGCVVFFGTRLLEDVFKLDDAVGAVPVHGICGAWGTIMTGVLAMPDKLAAADRLTQIGVQAMGVGVGFAWAFGTSFVLFKLIDSTIGMRVSAEEEIEGLNSAEHGTTLGTGALQKALIELAVGESDLAKRLDDSTGDESGELATAFNMLMGNLQQLVNGISSNAERLVSASTELSQISNEMTRSSEAASNQARSVSEVTARVSSNVEAMASSVGSVSQNVNSISQSASEVSAHIDGVSQEISGMTDASSMITEGAKRAVAVADEAKRRVTSASDTIHALGEAGQRIGDVLEAIRTIAAQTRMLALNATIEAARAGSAGRGFAVVASEVKRLADNTATATEDIEARIADIRGGTDNAVSVMSDIAQVIDSMNASADDIGQRADQQIRLAREIAERTAKARSNSADMVERITSVAESAVSASGEAREAAEGSRSVYGSIQEVNAAASQTSSSASRVRDTSDSVARIASELQQAVGQLSKGGTAEAPCGPTGQPAQRHVERPAPSQASAAKPAQGPGKPVLGGGTAAPQTG